MFTWLIILLCLFFGLLDLVQTDPHNDNYEVVGVSCAANEEVSCMMIKCPAGQNCPAENFCYNPKCVCRRGYRKLKDVCVKKHVSKNLEPKAVESALLKTHFHDQF